MPRLLQREKRLWTELALPKRSGRSCQGAPVRATTEHGVNKKAVIGCVSARFAGLPRQQGGDALKVVVGYGVAMHACEGLLRFRPSLNDLVERKVPTPMNFSFVHTT